jgi:hypothetical protein
MTLLPLFVASLRGLEREAWRQARSRSQARQLGPDSSRAAERGLIQASVRGTRGRSVDDLWIATRGAGLALGLAASYAWSVELRLLGPLELVDGDERAVGLPGGKPRRLLALLGLEAGRVVSVDRIVDVLWGERAPETAGRLVVGPPGFHGDCVKPGMAHSARLR